MFYRLGEFFRDNRDFIKGAAGVLLIIAGLVLVILSRILPGLLVILAGGILFMRTLSGVLNSSGYAGEEALYNGLGGQGRGASAKNRNTNTVASETTSDIWNQMTGDESNK